MMFLQALPLVLANNFRAILRQFQGKFKAIWKAPGRALLRLNHVVMAALKRQ